MNEHTERILSTLHKLSTDHDALRDDLSDMRESMKILSVYLTGNGDPQKGLILKVDRLEQESARRERWVKASIAASVSAIVTLIGAVIKSVLKS